MKLAVRFAFLATSGTFFASALQVIGHFAYDNFPPINHMYDFSGTYSDVIRDVNPTGQGLGLWDNRVRVEGDNDAYQTIGVLTSLSMEHFERNLRGNYQGASSECSGTIATIDGYMSMNGLPVVLTAAHCENMQTIVLFSFNDEDEPSGIRLLPLDDLLMTTDNDVAIYSLGSAPGKITPLNVILDTNIDSGMMVDAYGYSADRQLLSLDDNCTVARMHYETFFATDCDVYHRASGGPIVNQQGDIIMVMSGIFNENRVLATSAGAVIREADIVASGNFIPVRRDNLKP